MAFTINKRKLRIIGIIILILAIAAVSLPYLTKEKQYYDSNGKLLVKANPIKPNIVLIIIDTLRADRVHVYGGRERITMPNIDEFEKKAVTFLTTVVPAPMTTPSHASLFTGKYPFQHGVRDNNFFLTRDEITLAEILKNQGYTTAAFVSSFSVSSKQQLDQGFNIYDDELTMDLFYPNTNTTIYTEAQRRGDDTTDNALAWLEENKDKKPFFLWLHLYDPHSPYDGPRNNAFGKLKWDYYTDTAFLKVNGSHEDAPAHKENTRTLYDGEVLFADQQVGRLLDKLEEYGLKQDTLIIFMADHGESLGEHNYFDHGRYVYEVSTKVPFMIYYKDFKHIQIKDQVRNIDFLPTILDILRLPYPNRIEGRSLMPLIKGESLEEIPAFIESASCFPYPPYDLCQPKGVYGKKTGIRFNNMKFIISPGYGEEFYDLGVDPYENNNLIEKLNFEPYKKALLTWVQRWEPESKNVLEDEETKAKLKSLGYLS